jgi:tRNA pseudouridine32 synthase / 23S rRNA pseudouridine746 synthase
MLGMPKGFRQSKTAVPKGLAFELLLDYLVHKFPFIGAEVWSARLRSGKVMLESGRVVDERTRYSDIAGQLLHYTRESPNEPDIPFQHHILFEDERILIVDKPHFVPVVPAGKYTHQSLLWRLRAQGYGDDITPAHRIDQHTAGLVLWIKQSQFRAAYQCLFRDRVVRKTYEAIAKFDPALKLPLHYQSRIETGDHFMQMRTVDGPANSETWIELIKVMNQRAHYQLKPITGKRHQLRAHMAALGVAIENDPIYPNLQSEEQFLDFEHPLQLLAKRLEFNDPITQKAHRFESQQCLLL